MGTYFCLFIQIVRKLKLYTIHQIVQTLKLQSLSQILVLVSTFSASRYFKNDVSILLEIQQSLAILMFCHNPINLCPAPKSQTKTNILPFSVLDFTSDYLKISNSKAGCGKSERLWDPSKCLPVKADPVPNLKFAFSINKGEKSGRS